MPDCRSIDAPRALAAGTPIAASLTMGKLHRRWRRLDEPGLEAWYLQSAGNGIEVRSTVVHAGEQPFGLTYLWTLDSAWRTRTLRLNLHGECERTLLFERTGPASWRVDGAGRADLDGCDEIDVSATPFCNSLAIRHLQNRSGELTCLYVPIPECEVTPSRQRYDDLGGGRWRYRDLGACAGFEAVIQLDDEGLVRSYENLFEATGPRPAYAA